MTTAPPPRNPRVVILNDTSTRYHHGCARVMGNLVKGLEASGLIVSQRIPARAEFTKDSAYLSAISQADVIVINGEGTLHDGAEHGARLLQVMEIAERGNKPVALVNALWQDNPASWSDALRAMALVASRDSKSAQSLQAEGIPARLMPDLSLAEPFNAPITTRDAIIVGDSVKLAARTHLAHAAQRLGATYLPTKSLSQPIWDNPLARKTLWRMYNKVFTGSVPLFEMSRDVTAYLNRLSSAKGHITGRFHGICLSMLVETPFLALASTTSKVQTLLHDAGLGQDRLIDAGVLSRVTEVPPFTAEELAAIRTYRASATTSAQKLFQDIRGLV